MNLNRVTSRAISRSAFGLLASGCVYLSATVSASAAVVWQDIQFGGSLSQGYLDSTNNNYPVDTKGGTFDFREYALNASRTFGTHFRLAAQVFGEKLGKYGDDKPILDWAVADYNFRPEIGVQAGRLKYPRSMYSDVLDLDVVRPFIFLPQSIYDNRLRDFQASFDGAAIYGSVAVGRSSFDYKVFFGKLPMKTDSGVGDFFNTASLYRNPPGVQTLKSDNVRGAALTWNTPISGLRVNADYSYITNLYASGPFVAVPSLTSAINLEKSEYSSVGVEYTKGPWTLSGEYLVNRIHSTIILPAVIAPPSRSISGSSYYYVSVARKIGSKFEVGTYYDTAQNDHANATSVPASIRRHDWTVGARYDFNDHLIFKLEGHYITGEKDLFNVPGVENPKTSIRNNMFLFAAKTTVSF